jgi:hypothetical protein
MSYHDYLVSRGLASEDLPFDALIMAALAKADSVNELRLRREWPLLCDEAEARYDAPGAVLDSDPPVTRGILGAADGSGEVT